MQITVRAGHFYLYIAKSTQAHIDGRRIVGNHAGVRDENHVRFQSFFVGDAKGSKISGADFFFTFDHKFYIAGQAVGGHHGFKGFHMHVDLAFVIAGSTGENGTFRMNCCFAYHRFERRCFPQFIRSRRLDIVVTIHKDSWQRRINHFLTIYNRITSRFTELHFIGTSLNQFVLDVFGCFADVVFKSRIRRNGWNPEKFKKLVQKSVFVVLNVFGSCHCFIFDELKSW